MPTDADTVKAVSAPQVARESSFRTVRDRNNPNSQARSPP